MKIAQKYINPILVVLTLFLIMSFTIQENNVEGLTIRFRSVFEDYQIPETISGIQNPATSYPSITNRNFTTPAPIAASDGMKFVILKLTLKNEGDKNCLFDFEDVYISTEKDSLYQLYGLRGYFIETKTKIKPQKELKRVLVFEFPDNAKPKELFIEDKRYKIIEE